MYNRLKARKNAIKDAKKNLPGRDDPNFAQFEQGKFLAGEVRCITALYFPLLSAYRVSPG